ncbi:Hypothetical predicted protein [Octopus vulgaris]|uniref:Uncharacterized protein n=1 Tax=Octopus vulgaris TaxID=6645 RepID=A0AA36AXC6_OCTVU|nr:Hypothetical predicted protein [Octopus vulgaris]
MCYLTINIHHWDRPMIPQMCLTRKGTDKVEIWVLRKRIKFLRDFTIAQWVRDYVEDICFKVFAYLESKQNPIGDTD